MEFLKCLQPYSPVHVIITRYVVGYTISLWIGHEIVSRVNEKMRKKRNKLIKDQLDKGGFKTGLLGVTERFLYTTALLAGRPEFVGLWLTLKFADRWQEWRSLDRRDRLRSDQSNEKAEKFTPGWGRANIFLVGNAISIAFAFIGAVIIKRNLLP